MGLGRMEKFRCPMGRPREQPGRVNPSRSKADFVECDGGVEYVHCLGEGGNQIHKKNSRNDRAREPKTAWLLESHSQSRISSSISNSSSNSSSPPQQGGCDRSSQLFRSEILCSGFSVPPRGVPIPAPRSIARQAGVGAARGGAAKQLVTPPGRPLGSSLLLAPRLARLEQVPKP